MAGDIGTTAMGALVVNFVLQMKAEDGGSVPAHHLRHAVLGVKMTSGFGFWVQFLSTHEVSDHFSPLLRRENM